jgi:hypothetical protein
LNAYLSPINTSGQNTFHFNTYSNSIAAPHIKSKNSSSYGKREIIDGQWIFMYMGYSETEKKAIAYLKFEVTG